MNKELESKIKSFHGNVLGIGLTDKLSSCIEKNDNITECNLLNSYSKKKFKGKSFKRTIRIKKIRKKFKKKKVDYIICRYDEISSYMNTFVKDSVYINKSALYFFGDVDIEEVKKKYSRYNTIIDAKKYKDGLIVEIDNSLAKNNFIKELGYRIIDWFNKTIEIIGDILMG